MATQGNASMAVTVKTQAVLDREGLHRRTLRQSGSVLYTISARGAHVALKAAFCSTDLNWSCTTSTWICTQATCEPALPATTSDVSMQISDSGWAACFIGRQWARLCGCVGVTAAQRRRSETDVGDQRWRGCAAVVELQGVHEEMAMAIHGAMNSRAMQLSLRRCTASSHGCMQDMAKCIHVHAQEQCGRGSHTAGDAALGLAAAIV